MSADLEASCFYANSKTTFVPIPFVAKQFAFFEQNAKRQFNDFLYREKLNHDAKYVMFSMAHFNVVDNYNKQNNRHCFQTKYMFDFNNTLNSIIPVDEINREFCRFDTKNDMINYYQAHSKSILEYNDYMRKLTNNNRFLANCQYATFFVFDNQELVSLYMVNISLCDNISRPVLMRYLNDVADGNKDDFIQVLYPFHMYRRYPNINKETSDAIIEHMLPLMFKLVESALSINTSAMQCSYNIRNNELSYRTISDAVSLSFNANINDYMKVIEYVISKVFGPNELSIDMLNTIRSIEFVKINKNIFINHITINDEEEVPQVIVQFPPVNPGAAPVTLPKEDVPDFLEELAAAHACNE